MSQRREIEARLTLYDELTGILGAMRSFALAELRRVSKREAAQQAVMESLATALNDMSEALPSPSSSGTSREIWLLFGSARGFCGSFNEDVARFWREQTGGQGPLILIGERLQGILGTGDNTLCLTGAQGALDAAAAIDRILTAIDSIRGMNQDEFRLMACIRDEREPISQQLWPLHSRLPSNNVYPPQTFVAPAKVASGVAEHYLFHTLLALLLRSIRVENHMRLLQMETALRHLEQGAEDLQRQRNRLRQEEIVEEIELMVGSRHH